MGYSSVKIEFTGGNYEGSVLNIFESKNILNLNQNFVEERLDNGQTTSPRFGHIPGADPPTGWIGGHIDSNYVEAFSLDYNSAGLFDLTTGGSADDNNSQGIVIITAKYPGAIFSLISGDSNIIVTITNEVYVPTDPEPIPNSVTPKFLNFSVINAVPNAPSKGFEIIATGAWTITSILPDWIQIIQLSGTGNATSLVTPVNYFLLLPGEYTHDLIITIGTETFHVFITLTVVGFIKNPFLAGNLYFTKEPDYLSIKSTNSSTYVRFTIDIKVFKINTLEHLIFNRVYDFPLFKMEGDFHIGTIVHDLLEEIYSLKDYVPSLKTNYLKSQYRPAEISVIFEEKSYLDTTIKLSSGSLSMFKMAKGYKPFLTDSQLGLLTVVQQEVIRISPKSVLSTSFVSFGASKLIIKKNNKIIEEIQLNKVDNQVIYSYYRFVNDVKPGDSIDFIILKDRETRSQRFLVFPYGPESTFFFFENSNGLIESYEFTGRRRVNSTLKHVTTRKMKNLNSFEKKVKTDNIQSMIVNTGQLLKTDHRIIIAILSSSNVWCSFDNPEGPYFLVDGISTKLQNQDTDTNEESFDVEFNILENADAFIYPQ
jgi:hypothetical protein